MKKQILLAVLVFGVLSVFAQDTGNDPYKMFGHKSSTKYDTKISELLNIKNTDTTSKITALAFDIDNGYVLLFDKTNAIVRKDKISQEEILRFLSTDPLTKKYPELTPYQFASNTPIQAVDLDGKEAFFIHGTASGPEAWSPKLTNFITKNLTNNIHQDATFSWKDRNGYANNQNDRNNAAFDLVLHIIDYRKKNNITDEEITLIGHSHGGNVAIQAAHILNDIYGINVNIVNFNTPAYNGSKDKENPQVGNGINQLIHYWTKQDGVAGGAAGDDKYDNGGVRTDVTSIELNNPLKKGSLESHYLSSINLDELKTKLKKPDPVPAGQANPTSNQYDPTWKPPVPSTNNSSTPN